MRQTPTRFIESEFCTKKSSKFFYTNMKFYNVVILKDQNIKVA